MCLGAVLHMGSKADVFGEEYQTEGAAVKKALVYQ